MLQRSALPTPTPELVLVGVALRVLLDELPRRKRRRFVIRMTETLDMLSGGPTVSVLRVVAHHADPDLQTSRAQAAAWWVLIREAVERDMS